MVLLMYAKRPISEQFSAETLETLREQISGTAIGTAFRRWLRLWEQTRDIDRKITRAGEQLQDKLMEGLLIEQRNELEHDANTLAARIGNMRASCLNGVLCKLALWRFSQCPMAEAGRVEDIAAASAFSDLVSFAVRKPEAAGRLRS